jgi:hypothetical protein
MSMHAGGPEPKQGGDYEDVKLKIIQQEGYDMHDFGIFEDRAALLWRKPWIDGATRELTGGNSRSVENLRRQVEQLLLAARNRNPDVRTASTPSRRAEARVRVDVDLRDDPALERDLRRNPGSAVMAAATPLARAPEALIIHDAHDGVVRARSGQQENPSRAVDLLKRSRTRWVARAGFTVRASRPGDLGLPCGRAGRRGARR